MKRRLALRLFGRIALAQALAQETKPNVVFISYSDVGPYGGGELRRTP